jgi:hypothetical protein
MKQLRVFVNSKLESSSAADITDFVNTEKGFHVENDHFKGSILVRVKNFHKEHDVTLLHLSDDYFGTKKRLFSIQIEGMFKSEVNGDDLMLGAEFRRPITTPPFTSLLVEFAKFIDPGLHVENLNAKNADVSNGRYPMIYSPILCAINVMRIESSNSVLMSHKNVITEDTSMQTNNLTSESKRRSHFLQKPNRKAFTFKPNLIYKFDWFSPYVNWNTFELSMGLKVKVEKYLNGQGVTFVGRTRDHSRVFFVIEFRLV